MKKRIFKAGRSTLPLALMAALATPVAHAATINVTTTTDEVANPGVGCSLREAVMAIDASADGNGCTNVSTDGYGTNDTIILQADTYNLTITGLDESATLNYPNTPAYTLTNVPNPAIGDLDITRSVKIIGAGVDATTVQWDPSVPEADRDRIFQVFTTDTVTVNVLFQGMTITGGRTWEQLLGTGADGSVPGVPVEYYFRRAGGGIAVGAAANVAVIDPSVTGDENSSGRGGSLKPLESEPGGATISTVLDNVKVTGNQTQGDGAGIYNAEPMQVSNIIVSNNTSTTNGGGIYDEGNLDMEKSTLSDNKSEGGGGIFMTGNATVNIRTSTLSGNQAIGGGAISNRAGVTTNMVNSTISGNLATDVGAGFYSNGPGNLAFVTIANNISGADSPNGGSGINLFPSGSIKVNLIDVLLSANKGSWDGVLADAADPAYVAGLPASNCGYTGGAVGALVSGGHNLSDDDTCKTDLNDTTDLNADVNTVVDAKLGPLADNGGPTQTHALLAGSAAIGKGVAVTITGVDTSVDQRGVARDNPPDIGAFELPASAPTPTSSGGGSSGGCVYDPNGSSDWTLLILLAAGISGLLIRHRRKDTAKQ